MSCTCVLNLSVCKVIVRRTQVGLWALFLFLLATIALTSWFISCRNTSYMSCTCVVNLCELYARVGTRVDKLSMSRPRYNYFCNSTQPLRLDKIRFHQTLDYQYMHASLCMYPHQKVGINVIREMCGDFLETILKAGVQARFCHWTSTPPNNPTVYVTIPYQDTELYRCSFSNHPVLWLFIWRWYRPNLDGRLAVCWEWDTTGPVLIPRMGH